MHLGIQNIVSVIKFFNCYFSRGFNVNCSGPLICADAVTSVTLNTQKNDLFLDGHRLSRGVVPLKYHIE